MYLLDTNICIYAMKGKYPRIAEKLLTIRPEQIKISVITVMELEYGAARSKWGDRSREALRAFLAAYDMLPFTVEDAVLCGGFREKLPSLGTPIGAYDIMIAAQGVSRGLTVVTHNISEFQRIPSISLEDWAK